MGCPVGPCADLFRVKAFSFPETGSQAYCHAHETRALSLETFPDIFDASLFSRHTHTPTHTRGHLHLKKTRAFLYMK